MFSQLPEPALDPILSLSVAYRNDPRTDKVDLASVYIEIATVKLQL